MNRGVSFKVSQENDNILWKILNCINIKKYNWFNIKNQNESWHRIDNFVDKPFLENVFYNGESFAEQIQKNHYIIFLKLEAYEGYSDFYDIHSYEEFQKNSCKLLLLMYDCDFVEIYAKEQYIIYEIYKNAQRNNFMEIKYICDTNDERKTMDVL